MRFVALLAAVACSKSAPPPPPKPAAAPPAPKADGGAATDCVVSMLVDRSGVWIGTTANTCHNDTLDFAWVEAELSALRKQFEPACVPDLELAGGAGSYQDLIDVMDHAVKVGLLDVGLATQAELAVKLPGAHPDAHCRAPDHPVPPPPVPPPPGGPTFTPRFSADGQLTALEGSGLDLPPADSKTALQSAPVIVVTRTEVTYAGKHLASIDEIPRDGSLVPPLRAALESDAKKSRGELTATQQRWCDDAKRGIRPLPGRVCPEGLAILQADAATDVGVINTIVQTAKAAGFDNLLFAVKNR